MQTEQSEEVQDREAPGGQRVLDLPTGLEQAAAGVAQVVVVVGLARRSGSPDQPRLHAHALAQRLGQRPRALGGRGDPIRRPAQQGGHRPFHCGSRFSKNAVTPSWMSSVAKGDRQLRAQVVPRVLERHVVLAPQRVLAQLHEHRRLARERCAQSPPPRRGSSAATTRLTIPRRSASRASKRSPRQQHLRRLLARHVAHDERQDHEREDADVDLGRAEGRRPRWRRSGRRPAPAPAHRPGSGR
jgi:hypothetical protein